MLKSIFALAFLLVSPWSSAFAQTYPTKPVHIVVPYPPGGGVDLVARIVAKAIGDSMGQTFFVENRPGANGNVGAEFVARSVPDGYTLLAASNTTMTINPSLYRSMPIDLLRDLQPVCTIATQPSVLLVTSSLAATTVKDLVAYAQAHPNALNYASAGVGSSSHVTAELFRLAANAPITHVPYRGNGPAMTDLIGGQVQLMFNNFAPSMAQVKAGKIRALAVTSERRSSAAPEIPTMVELGYPNIVFNLWVGFFGPDGMPANVVAKLNAEVSKAMQSSEVRARLIADGNEPYITPMSDIKILLRRETDQWAKVLKAANIEPQ